MGDLPTNQKNLKEKLLNSSKKTMDKSKVTNPITDCVASADNTILNETCPKKDQAIVFDSIDNIPQIDYVLAICKLIPSKCINYVSRISNNRFCVYFTDKNSVDYLIENHSNIVINDHSSIKIRRLINPAKRIIISNVSPAIPNISIKALLQEHNIQLLSQITHINAGFNIKELAHILSFRRQVYINPNDFAKLPSSLLIIHDNTPHRRHSFMLQM
ncbi:DNA replication licensing factor MCM4-like [Aphis craccivora]|uniref:DNA replication licensing factor MCM4-like n=1 Tax=Aphis craccivora TaxID=307492 RepID=A0A6G0VXA4_APHCR|nr:DNA replication licensing factor MCM4-like [Aphis craccivora]